MAAKRKRKSPGPLRSRAQQRFVFGVLAKRDPKAKTWARRWAHKVGETGGRTPASRAAYRRLPRRKGARKHG